MKIIKVIVLFLLLNIVLFGCSQQKTSESNQTPSQEPTLNSNTPQPSQDSLKPTPKIVEQPAKSEPPAVIINDIATWQHPTKEVFDKYRLSLKKVELSKNSTYPTFFDFIALKERLDERDIEKQLVQKITKFLLEQT